MSAQVKGIDRSFALLAKPSSTRCLILGSMPGRRSLIDNEYYAHPQNCFWRLMQDIFAIDSNLSYQVRVDKLLSCGVGLWDVVASCERKGSLDSAIVDRSVEVNDFTQLVASHTKLENVFFNGAKAEELFVRHVQPAILSSFPERVLGFKRLPSTSPAHAAMTYQAKLKAWREISK